jgi:hypothetical protein
VGHVGVVPGFVSKHPAQLRLARLENTRRDSNGNFYWAENEHVLRLVTEALLHADHLLTTAPARHTNAGCHAS